MAKQPKLNDYVSVNLASLVPPELFQALASYERELTGRSFLTEFLCRCVEQSVLTFKSSGESFVLQMESKTPFCRITVELGGVTGALMTTFLGLLTTLRSHSKSDAGTSLLENPAIAATNLLKAYVARNAAGSAK